MSGPRWDPARFPPAARENRWVQTIAFSRDPIGELMAARARLGPVFSVRLIPYQALVCGTDPATNQEILTDQERFVGGEAAGLLEPIVGPHSLILTPPPQHLPNRKRLLPPFHGERIARWTDAIRDLAVEHLPALATGTPTPVRPWAQRFTLDVILRVVFGIEDAGRRATYRQAIDRFVDPRFGVLLFTPDFVKADLGRFSPGGVFARRKAVVDALLFEEIAARRRDPGDREDVLSVLLSTDLTDEELRDELMGLVLAGHETTATALSWTLHLLSHHTGPVDVQAAVKESMRLRPPVIDAIRTATCDTELGGHPVPKGAHVSAMFTATHQAPELWDDAAAFRPERHLDGKPVPYALTPFGGGVRRCIGAALAQLELDVALPEILDRCDLQPAGPPERAILSGVSIVPAKGARVVLTQRGAGARADGQRAGGQAVTGGIEREDVAAEAAADQSHARGAAGA